MSKKAEPWLKDSQKTSITPWRRKQLANYVERGVKAAQNAFVRTLGLKVYGDSLCTTRVASEMTALAVVLVLQFVIDWWAWDRVWSYGLPLWSWFWPLMLSLILAMGILLFDRSIVIADTSRSRWQLLPLAGRFVLLFVIALLTAIPVELSVFEGDIETKIALREQAGINSIREQALTEETAKYDQRIADAKKAWGENAGDLVTRGQNDINEFTEGRKAQREILQADADNKALEARKEAAGKGLSGKYGTNQAYKAMQNQADYAAVALAAFDAETQLLLGGLRTARDAKRDDAVQKGGESVAALMKEKDETLAKVRAMDPAPLAKQYGGRWEKQEDGPDKFVVTEWKSSRGLRARWTTLQEMAAEDPSTRVMVWGCRLVMIILGILVLGLKLMASEEFRYYYSFSVQGACAKDAGTEEIAMSVGYAADRAKRAGLGFLPRVRDDLEEVLKAQRDLAQAFHRFRDEMARLAQERAERLASTLAEIRSDLHEQWREQVQPAIFHLAEIEERCTLQGIEVPTWPTQLRTDPRDLEDPWKVSKDQLVELGWEDPEPARTSFQQRLAQLTVWRMQVDDELIIMENELGRYLLANPGVTEREIRVRFESDRRNSWRNRILPTLRKIRELEEEARMIGVGLPRWQTQNPEEAWRLPDPETLRKLGWDQHGQPIERRTVTAIAPPTLPPPPPFPTAQPATEPDFDLDIEMPAAAPAMAPPPPPPPAPTNVADTDVEERWMADGDAGDVPDPDNGVERLAAAVLDPGAAAQIRANAELVICHGCKGRVRRAKHCSQCGVELTAPAPPDGDPTAHAESAGRGATRRARRDTTPAKPKPTA